MNRLFPPYVSQTCRRYMARWCVANRGIPFGSRATRSEISGQLQRTRVVELLHWFARYYRGAANPKWLSSHAAELAYFILSALNSPPQERDLVLEEAAKVAERTYAKDAFHFELGAAIASAIRALRTSQASPEAGEAK